MAAARDIEGVNPSYFAGMPEVALDPNAGKQNPQYAHLLSQAMQNRAQETNRRRENDEANVFKAREQSQQARRDRRSNEISKRNAAVNEAGEARLKSEQDFSQDRLKSADTRELLNAVRKAQDAKDYTAVDVFSRALRERGYKVDELQESDEDFAKRMPASSAAPPPPAAPSVDRAPVGPRPGPPPPTASFPPVREAETAPPMRAVPAGPPPPRATASFPPANGAPPPPARSARPPRRGLVARHGSISS